MLIWAGNAQTVSNVWFEQVDKTIKIYYDLSEKSDIRIYLSTDGGKSFESSPLTNVSGDVGENVKSGKGKMAVWDVLASREKLQGEKVCFKVRAINSRDRDYVDLGLPSGTLWKKENEKGFYTYDEAVKKFGDRLPTKEQLEELKDKCRWTWVGERDKKAGEKPIHWISPNSHSTKTDKGYIVTGPNGNSIVFLAAGLCSCIGSVNDVGTYGYYWSSILDGSRDAFYLYFNSGRVYMGNNNRCYGRSVRLVQKR